MIDILHTASVAQTCALAHLLLQPLPLISLLRLNSSHTLLRPSPHPHLVMPRQTTFQDPRTMKMQMHMHSSSGFLPRPSQKLSSRSSHDASSSAHLHLLLRIQDLSIRSGHRATILRLLHRHKGRKRLRQLPSLEGRYWQKQGKDGYEMTTATNVRVLKFWVDN